MGNVKNNIGFLFDLDGVIIDSENEYTKIWSKIDEEYPTGIDNFAFKIKGSTLSKILTENYPVQSLRDKVAERLHELENQMTYSYLPFARDFLIELNNRNLDCVLVTSSDNEKMRHLWDQIPELKDLFKFIITGDLVTSSKPNPEGYLLAASKIDADARKCVVFEDSLQGVMAGKNAGAFVVGVAGTLSHESLAPFSNIIIDNFNELNIDNLIHTLTER